MLFFKNDNTVEIYYHGTLANDMSVFSIVTCIIMGLDLPSLLTTLYLNSFHNVRACFLFDGMYQSNQL